MDDRTLVVAVEKNGPLPNKSLLWEYFESKERSDGGTVDKIDIHGEGTAIVTFRHYEDCANVESRDHKLDDVALLVYPYYGIEQQSANPDYDNTATLNRQPQPMKQLSTEDIHMAVGKVRYFEKFPSKCIQTLTKQFEDCAFLDDRIVIKGQPDGFKEKVDKLKVCFLDVKEETFDINKPVIYACLTSKKGRKEVEKIENKLKCTIQVDQGFYTSRDKDEESAAGKSENQVTLVTGDIAQQEVDVLVGCVGSDLDLTAGGVSSMLLRVGGKELQSQCKRKYPDGIHIKDLAKVGGGNLKCQEVYLCCLPEFKEDNNMKAFGSVVYKCLFEATEMGYKSIAFPALGAGRLGYPPKQVARMMFFKITQFISYKTTLQDIRIVVPPSNKKTVEAFELEQPDFMSKQEDAKDDNGNDQMGNVERDDVRIGKLKIHVKQGDISMEDTRAVVNFANTAIALNAGSTSSDLLRACGKDVDVQCQLAVNTLAKSGVAVTTAPNIPADFIVHIAVDHFRGSLKDIIKACLKAANDHSFTSLAFPSLWTDSEGMSLKNVAKLFISCLEDYEKKHTTLKDISVVISEATDCSIFLALLEEIISKKARNKRGRFSYRKRSTGTGTSPRGNDMNQMTPSIEQVFMKKARDSDAEVTIYSENYEALKKAHSEVQALYKSQFVKKTIVQKSMGNLSSEKVAVLKEKMEDINVYATFTWSKGVVEVEGLADDVMALETLLQKHAS